MAAAICSDYLTMADWSALPDPAVVSIARRLELIEDFVAFRRTCTSWRAATSLKDFDRSCPRLPLLMLDPPKWYDRKIVDERKFFSLSTRKICKVSLPEAREMGHCLVSKGWIIMVEYSNDMSLLHPITRIRIHLPTHPKHCYPFQTAVLSASPSETSEYILMIVFKTRGMSHLEELCSMAFWKPGDMTWTQIEVAESSYWIDHMCYYNEKFYAIASRNQVLVYDVLGINPNKATKVMDLPWGLSPSSHLVDCAEFFSGCFLIRSSSLLCGLLEAEFHGRYFWRYSINEHGIQDIPAMLEKKTMVVSVQFVNSLGGASILMYLVTRQIGEKPNACAAANMQIYGTSEPVHLGEHYYLIDIPVDLVAGRKDRVIRPSMIRKRYEVMKNAGMDVSLLCGQYHTAEERPPQNAII